MGKCHFRNEWLQKKDDLGFPICKWAKVGKKDDEIFCFVCDVVVKVTKGFQAVVQHYKGKKHQANAKTKLHVSQCHLIFDKNYSSTSQNLTDAQSTSTSTEIRDCTSDQTVSSVAKNNVLNFFSARDSASKAEIIWSMVVVVKNYSARSCQDMSAIFQAMFPGLVPEGFSLSPKKFSYIITHALGPYFRETMLRDAQKEFFSVQYDETTNSKGKKELQINVKYWSNIKDEIVTHHLETIFLGTATAEVLSASILAALNKGSLSLRKLISVGSDGPAVNLKVFRLLNEEILGVREKSLLSIGTCNLHHVNNAFLKGLEAFGSDVPDLVIAIYYFFHGWPSRQEEYSASQKHTNVPQHSFIKHVPTRWLSLEAAVNRLIEQWPAIQHYFLKFLPLHKKVSSITSYDKIVSLLKQKTMKAQLYFVLSSAEIFVKFNSFFQKEEPLIHILQLHYNSLLLTLMGRVSKKNSDEQDLDNAFESDNLLPPKKVECGQLVKKELEGKSERDKLEFKIGARNHYAACGQYLTKKLDKRLKYFSCLHVTEIVKNNSCKYIAEIAKSMPEEMSVDVVMDEWKLLQTEPFIKNSTPGMRIDHFWRDIFKIKTCLGEIKYPLLKTIVKMCLSIFHGSADVERGFSLSARILTEERAAMNEITLNARLAVIDGLKLFDNNPIKVPITREILVLAQNAHRSYVEYCEKQKREEEEQREEMAKQKKRIAEEEENKLKVKKMKVDIDNLKNDLKEARRKYLEKKETRENLFDEANKRFKTAVSKNDIKEINLAQAMMEGVDVMKHEEIELQKIVSKLENNVDNKTSILFSKFVKEKE